MTSNLIAQEPQADQAMQYDFLKNYQKAMELYQRQLDELPFNYEEQDVQTQFGSTHIISAGDVNKPPLLLLHGVNASAPTILDAFAHLTNSFQVFAVDIIGQPNKSAFSRPSKKDGSYGIWVHEVIEKLGLRNITLVGVSFGGFIALKAAAYSDRNIKYVYAIDSGGLANGNMFKMLFKAFIPMKKYKKTGDEKYLDLFLSSAVDNPKENIRQTTALIVRHYNMDLTPIPIIKGKELSKNKNPHYYHSLQK